MQQPPYPALALLPSQAQQSYSNQYLASKLADTACFSSSASPSQSGGDFLEAQPLVHVRVPAGLEELHERGRPVLADRWSGAPPHLPEIDQFSRSTTSLC